MAPHTKWLVLVAARSSSHQCCSRQQNRRGNARDPGQPRVGRNALTFEPDVVCRRLTYQTCSLRNSGHDGAVFIDNRLVPTATVDAKAEKQREGAGNVTVWVPNCGGKIVLCYWFLWKCRTAVSNLVSSAINSS